MFKKLLSGLFGSDRQAAPGATTKAADAVEYKGYEIVSQPDDQSGQYRVSGWIRKADASGETLEHRFERSDMLPGRYIDEVGEAMFEPDPRRAGDSTE